MQQIICGVLCMRSQTQAVNARRRILVYLVGGLRVITATIFRPIRGIEDTIVCYSLYDQSGMSTHWPANWRHVL